MSPAGRMSPVSDGSPALSGSSLVLSSPLRNTVNMALRRSASSQDRRPSLFRHRSASDTATIDRFTNADAVIDALVPTVNTLDLIGAPQIEEEHGGTQIGDVKIRIVPQLESTRSLHFEPIERTVSPLKLIQIGRFTEKNASKDRITFKSKVVSRRHAEIWSEQDQIYLRDTASSSGTFLNHLRLSPPNKESKVYQVKDGDVIQLGVDYQGGTEDIYRCVKMCIEINRAWQKGANKFNIHAMQSLRQLNQGCKPNERTNSAMLSITDCCICLFPIAPCQALFIAPCSHIYHYKCIRPLLNLHHPGFLCPLCRTFADLGASVEVDTGWDELLMKGEANVSTPNAEMDRPTPTPDIQFGDDPIQTVVTPVAGGVNETGQSLSSTSREVNILHDDLESRVRNKGALQ